MILGLISKAVPIPLYHSLINLKKRICRDLEDLLVITAAVPQNHFRSLNNFLHPTQSFISSSASPLFTYYSSQGTPEKHDQFDIHHKMGLEHLTGPKSKKVLKCRGEGEERGSVKRTRSQPERVPSGQSLNNLNNKITIALNFEPKDKIY